MLKQDFKYPDTKAYEFVVQTLQKRGVDLHDLAQMAYDLQSDFLPDLTVKECYDNLIQVLHKRELLNNAMVALELDRLCEEGQIKEPLESIIKNDAGVFGVDEALAIQISEIYGTIGVTNFGNDSTQHVNTFIDDLLGAIVAALCGKLAHKYA